MKPGFSDFGLAVYPNPVSTELKVEATEPFSEISLYDAAGKEVFQETFDPVEYYKAIVTDKFEPGIFFLQVRFQDRMQTKKIIIH